MQPKILGLSVILHIITIACILGMVFYHMILKSSYKVFSRMILHATINIYGLLPATLFNNLAGKYADSIINTLETLDKQEPQTVKYNKKLFMNWNIFIGCTMAVFIGLVIFLKAYQMHSFYIMLFETAVSFIIVGGIELAFFLLIALHYAPIYPSDLEPLFIKAATEYLSGKTNSWIQDIKQIITV